MLARKRLRILVPHSRTLFFIDRGRELGVEYDYGKAFEDRVNAGRKAADLVQVAFLPVPRDQLLAWLVEGKGDIAAAALTMTPEREKLVDFVRPGASGVKEVLVTGAKAPPVAALDDLAGQTLHVRRSSSYHEHLATLNETFRARGLEPIELEPADESLEDEDLLEMVSAGLLPWVVVDRYVAVFWAQLLPGLRVREDVVIHEGGEISWAIRKGSPKLAAELSAFMRTHKPRTQFGNVVLAKYLKSTKFVNDALAASERRRFEATVELFREYGDRYGFDHLMLMAQGYQESQLDQTRRSARGAVGIMQLLPATAAHPTIGILGIDADTEKNVHAGAKYLRLLVDTYLDDPAIDEKNRVLMAFAAYNAGPGNLRKFRRLAEKSGLDPNVWFGNVEVGAARIVGRETVEYVANIFKYYVAYTLAQAREVERAEQEERLRQSGDAP